MRGSPRTLRLLRVSTALLLLALSLGFNAASATDDRIKGHHGSKKGHHGPHKGHHRHQDTGLATVQNLPGQDSDGLNLKTSTETGDTSDTTETTSNPCSPPPPVTNNTYSLGLPDLPTTIGNNTPSYNPQSRYLTAGLSFESKSGIPVWSFATDVDWRFLLGPVDNQDQYGKCGSCWAFAVSSAIQAAYAIQAGQQKLAVEPSQQQFLDCTVDSCAGGYPTTALQYAANPAEPPVFASHVYAYSGQKGSCRAKDFRYAPSSKISMFEQTANQGPLALMLAVQRQPVVVNLVGSTASFQNYQGGIYNDPSCFNEENFILDHTVLVVGYHYEGLGSCNSNYFVLRNSWGTEWGENGYMRMAMEFNPYGVCGITSQLGLYPVIQADTFQQPCSFGVCGGGTCNADSSFSSTATTTSTAPPPSPSQPVDDRCKPVTPSPPPPPPFTCDCSSQPFLTATTNIDGTQSCVSKVQCGLFLTNPCGQGTCVDNGSGGYTCICPAGTKNDELPDGSISCVPVNEESPDNSISTYTAQPGDTCYLVYTLFTLTETEFQSQNPGLDCSKPLNAGTVVNIKHETTCAVRYPVSAADQNSGSCDSIRAKFPGVDLLGLNPGLNCGSLVAGQQICVQAGSPGFNSSQLCTQYIPVTDKVTCDNTVSEYSLTYLTLYQLNPGLLCDNLSPLAGQQICVKSYPVSAVRCAAPSRLYRVSRGDTCITIAVQKFKRRLNLIRRYNNGWVCSPRNLFVGMPLCIP